MEVHHHTSSKKEKHFKHYLFEFLMLFLAVFCGFLAEYQLEHVIEHQREKKYAASMLDDLRKDTTDLSADIMWWSVQLNRADTILTELDKIEKDRNPIVLYRCVSFMRRYNSFEYHDRTVEQLKNAGFFRLLRKKNVADAIMEYDAMVRRTLMNVEDGANQIYFHLNFFQNKLFDSRYFPTLVNIFDLDSLYQVHPGAFQLQQQMGKAAIFEYANHLRYFRGNMVLRIGVMQNLLRSARSTIDLISEEYKIRRS